MKIDSEKINEAVKSYFVSSRYITNKDFRDGFKDCKSMFKLIIDELNNEEMKKLKPCYLSDGTEETGKRIIEELMKIEGASNYFKFECNDKILKYYFLDEDNDVLNNDTIPEGYVLTELPKETKELTFPRWMMVWHSNLPKLHKRFVVSNLNGRFQAVYEHHKEKFDKGDVYTIIQWENAKEIEVEQPKEEAKKEIAINFNVTSKTEQLEDRIQQLEKALEEERSKNEKIKAFNDGMKLFNEIFDK